MVDDARIRSVAVEMLNHLGIDVEDCEEWGGSSYFMRRRPQASGQGFHAVILDSVVPGSMGRRVTMKKLPEIHPNVKGIVSIGVIPKTRY